MVDEGIDSCIYQIGVVLLLEEEYDFVVWCNASSMICEMWDSTSFPSCDALY